jgi:hypothetical protein
MAESVSTPSDPTIEGSPPRVFVSYSHDSPTHKAWVAGLCTRLQQAEIDTVLDQWDLSLGDDITLFMENGLSNSHRVLVICTDEYVRKADAGEGGVGYERLILTSELVRNISTNKFIPVLRGISGKQNTPKFLSTRLYIDFTDDSQFEENLEELLRELHKSPALPKPPLGRNPFRGMSLMSAPAPLLPPLVTDTVESQTLEELYTTAVQIARSTDVLGWRQLVKQTRKDFHPRLNTWRREREVNPPNTQEEPTAAFDAAVSIVAPMIVVALAGVESGKEQFRDQRALFDDLIHVDDWNHSGRTVLVELPFALGYLYQAFHGAICLTTGQLKLALNLAEMKVNDRYSNEHTSLWRIRRVIGWPTTLGSCSDAWKYLAGVAKRWQWVTHIFGNDQDFRAGLTAYYIALNIVELSTRLAEGKTLSGHNIGLSVPIDFATEGEATIRRAMRLLAHDPATLAQIWNSRGLARKDIELAWPGWISICHSWLANVYPYGFIGYGDRIHSQLFSLLPE